MDTIQIREYGSFVVGEENGRTQGGYITLTKRTFAGLRQFILESSNQEGLELMGLSARKGVGEIITAKNYVGILTMQDGTTIEILPKICSAIADDAAGSKTKALLVQMLKTLRSSPYKKLQTAHVDMQKMNIFEIFIRMFIDEVFAIVKRGLRSGYETVEENTTFFKGKLKFSQQLRRNYIHKERSFVEYDIFSENRPENRLLKAALQYLHRHTGSAKNKNDLKRLLNSFQEVEASLDPKQDFSRVVPDRQTRDYTTALLWAKVFLTGKSFTSFTGSQVAMALLFPMEKLFESYIAAMLKKALAPEFRISVQDEEHHLFEAPKAFRMRPDIVISRGKSVWVLDTKWKLLSQDKPYYGLSQGDMYQMYAYQKKYGAESVTLLYPKTDLVQETDITFRENAPDGVTVQVRFVDLFDIHNSLAALTDTLFS